MNPNNMDLGIKQAADSKNKEDERLSSKDTFRRKFAQFDKRDKEKTRSKQQKTKSKPKSNSKQKSTEVADVRNNGESKNRNFSSNEKLNQETIEKRLKQMDFIKENNLKEAIFHKQRAFNKKAKFKRAQRNKRIGVLPLEEEHNMEIEEVISTDPIMQEDWIRDQLLHVWKNTGFKTVSKDEEHQIEEIISHLPTEIVTAYACKDAIESLVLLSSFTIKWLGSNHLRRDLKKDQSYQDVENCKENINKIIEGAKKYTSVDFPEGSTLSNQAAAENKIFGIDIKSSSVKKIPEMIVQRTYTKYEIRNYWRNLPKSILFYNSQQQTQNNPRKEQNTETEILTKKDQQQV
jgi:hypothetical protein